MNLERETGIEPATNSLEGCDSTTELLPPSRLARFASLGATAGKPAAILILGATTSNPAFGVANNSLAKRPSTGLRSLGTLDHVQGAACLERSLRRVACQP